MYVALSAAARMKAPERERKTQTRRKRAGPDREKKVQRKKIQIKM